MTHFEHPQLSRLRSELAASPALVQRILAELPPVEVSEVVVIRCDPVSVDIAIARTLALAVNGIEARIELIKQ